jgi:23S rRNA (adenine2503-C2)-methyltransferase
MAERLDILGRTSEEFVAAASEHGIRAPRAIETYRRTFREGVPRVTWVEQCVSPIVRAEQDGDAIKFIQQVGDGLEVESVVLPREGRGGRLRNTLCVSSQVGCALGCGFCETAQMGKLADLDAATIIAQWHAARFELGFSIDNVVFMGMGEPMDNLDAVLQAIRILADRNGPAVPSSHIAVSTVGRVAGIRRLTQFSAQWGFRRLRLAVSINAPNDKVRSRLMPINRAEPMAKLMDAMLAWRASRRSRVLIEYVLIPGVNDAPEQADELCAYLRPLECTVNIVPYNPRRDSPWPAPDEADVERFIRRIAANGKLVKRRRTMGRRVAAACGQLGNPRLRRKQGRSHE